MLKSDSFKIEPSAMVWPYFQDLPFLERVKMIAKAGYKSVEISVECRNWTEHQAAEYSKELKKIGICVDSVTTDLLGSGRPEFSCVNVLDRQNLIDNIRHRVSIMKSFNAKNLIMVMGDIVPELSEPIQYENCKERLMLALELLESENFNIFIEPVNHEDNPKKFLWSIEKACKLIRDINNPRIKLLYDLYHAQISNGNLIRHLIDHIDIIGLIHTADVPGRHEPGTGEINFPSIYRVLAKLKYRGYVGMEFMPTGDHFSLLETARDTLLSTIAEVELRPST